MSCDLRSHATPTTGSFKRETSYAEGSPVRPGKSSRPHHTNNIATLVGSSNEVSVCVNGVDTLALLDTGSTVTTLSREFYDSHLADSQPIHALNELLMVECADGNKLPYDGYVDLDITVSGLPVGESQSCLALVIPRSNYNSRVPLLIGTNLLSTFLAVCKEEYGDRLLQSAGFSRHGT